MSQGVVVECSLQKCINQRDPGNSGTLGTKRDCILSGHSPVHL